MRIMICELALHWFSELDLFYFLIGRFTDFLVGCQVRQLVLGVAAENMQLSQRIFLLPNINAFSVAKSYY